MNRPPQLKSRRTLSAHVRLAGGLDLESPEQSIDPGAIISGRNHEQVPEGGYRRIDGYEPWTRGRATAGDVEAELTINGLYWVDTVGVDVWGEEYVGQSSGATARILTLVNVPGQTERLLAVVMTSGGAFERGETITTASSAHVLRITEALDGDNEQLVFVALRDLLLSAHRVVDLTPPSADHVPLGLAAAHGEAVHVTLNKETPGAEYIGVYGDTSQSISLAGAGWSEAPIQDFCAGQFTGAADRRYLCLVNGTGPALIRRPGQPTPLTSNPTGATDEKVTHCAAFSNHLWLSVGSSLFHSELANEMGWDVMQGAGEIAFGEAITGLVVDGQALIVTSANTTKYITGNSKLDFQLLDYSPNLGAVDKTLRNMPHPTFLDSRGVTNMQRSQAFSDFGDTMISAPVRRWIEGKQGVAVIGSQVSRKKSQYRIFWNDKTALYITYRAGQPVGMMPVQFDRQFQAVYTLDTDEGEIQGAIADGVFWKLDNGLGFAGAPIPALFALAHHHLGAATRKKQIKRLRFDLDASEDNELQVRPVFNYADSYGDDHHWKSLKVVGGTAQQPVSSAMCHTQGAGLTVSVVLRSATAKARPYTIHGVTMEYMMGAQRR